MRLLLLSILLVHLSTLEAQPFSWSWEARSPMPETVANNAVTVADSAGERFVYSFAGIDSSRLFSGIHLKSWRYRVSTDTWETIAPLPDTTGKVAAAAHTVRNKVYIIGGYHVFANGSELSSDRVHIYDPVLNQYETDGATIPVPIDDQVQAVWRDSLIYVITGWSNTTNVPDVQIYDPIFNQWSEGTAVPNNHEYKVFGASGVIIGDTIFYMGGARFGNNFPLGSIFRTGIIDPQNPTQISWSEFSHPLALGYRMGAFVHNQSAIWAGGSAISYNYNGIAYNGSGPVPPLNRLVNYHVPGQNIVSLNDTLPPIMDLRGVAQISEHEFMIAGGMEAGPAVSRRTTLLRNTSASTGIDKTVDLFPFEVRQDSQKISIRSSSSLPFRVSLYSLSGILLYQNSSVYSNDQILMEQYPSAYYLLKVEQQGQQFSRKIRWP